MEWYIIENRPELEKAMKRYEEIKNVERGTTEHREKMLLVKLISDFEDREITQKLPEIDPVEAIKIRMEDFGYNAAKLAEVYGDKGTVSKVLNYKQGLSLGMIRKFSRLLKIPTDLLIKEYSLDGA